MSTGSDFLMFLGDDSGPFYLFNMSTFFANVWNSNFSDLGWMWIYVGGAVPNPTYPQYDIYFSISTKDADLITTEIKDLNTITLLTSGNYSLLVGTTLSNKNPCRCQIQYFKMYPSASFNLTQIPNLMYIDVGITFL